MPEDNSLHLKATFTNTGLSTWRRTRYDITSSNMSILEGPGDGVIIIQQQPSQLMAPEGKNGAQTIELKSNGLLSLITIPAINAIIEWENEATEKLELVLFAPPKLGFAKQPFWYAFVNGNIDKTERTSAPLELSLSRGGYIRITPQVDNYSLELTIELARPHDPPKIGS